MKKNNKKFLRNKVTELFNNNDWDTVTSYMITVIVKFGRILGIKKELLKEVLIELIDKEYEQPLEIEEK